MKIFWKNGVAKLALKGWKSFFPNEDVNEKKFFLDG
jgi:hypothetical protein